MAHLAAGRSGRGLRLHRIRLAQPRPAHNPHVGQPLLRAPYSNDNQITTLPRHHRWLRRATSSTDKTVRIVQPGRNTGIGDCAREAVCAQPLPTRAAKPWRTSLAAPDGFAVPGCVSLLLPIVEVFCKDASYHSTYVLNFMK